MFNSQQDLSITSLNETQICLLLCCHINSGHPHHQHGHCNHFLTGPDLTPPTHSERSIQGLRSCYSLLKHLVPTGLRAFGWLNMACKILPLKLKDTIFETHPFPHSAHFSSSCFLFCFVPQTWQIPLHHRAFAKVFTLPTEVSIVFLLLATFCLSFLPLVL